MAFVLSLPAPSTPSPSLSSSSSSSSPFAFSPFSSSSSSSSSRPSPTHIPPTSAPHRRLRISTFAPLPAHTPGHTPPLRRLCRLPCPFSSASPVPLHPRFIPCSTTSPRAFPRSYSLAWATPRPAAAAAAAAASRPPLLTLVSTIVGVCVLIGSVLYKIPQVWRVVRRRSARGISGLMYALETLGTTFSCVYFARRAFPFATYGESVFIMAQNVLLMALIVVYQRRPILPAVVGALLYAVGLAVLTWHAVPLGVLMALQVCSIPILNLARVPQIVLNWRRKSTGELSPVTLGLQLLGNVARIFTTVAQVGDPLMFAGICVATCFNGTLFGQWIFYSRRRKNAVEQVPGAEVG